MAKVQIGLRIQERIATRLCEYVESEKLNKSTAVEKILCEFFGMPLDENPRTEMLLAAKDAEIERLTLELAEAKKLADKARRPQVNNLAFDEDRFTMEKG